MALYLDTEFNGFGGELISLALASSTHGRHFYVSLHLPDKIDPWVAEHVVPFIYQCPDYACPVWDQTRFKHALAHYLARRGCGETIYADWPKDFAHMLQMLVEPNGVSLIGDLELDMRLINSGGLKPISRTTRYPMPKLSCAGMWAQKELVA